MKRIHGFPIGRWVGGSRLACPCSPWVTGPARCSSSGTLEWPETKLHAAAAVQNEAYAMATGPIDEDVEGVFILNVLTGDLQCSVMSIRTGRFAGLFRTNVIKDLGLDPAKRPSYLMTTGQVQFSARPRCRAARFFDRLRVRYDVR